MKEVYFSHRCRRHGDFAELKAKFEAFSKEHPDECQIVSIEETPAWLKGRANIPDQWDGIEITGNNSVAFYKEVFEDNSTYIEDERTGRSEYKPASISRRVLIFSNNEKTVGDWKTIPGR